MLRIAHVSDLHVLSPAGAEWRRILFNKRITGHANLVLRRGRAYRREFLEAVLREAAARADHVVVTGDITNLALESEYQVARGLLGNVARSAELTVVPGNHDIYLPRVRRARRFHEHFGDFLTSDLPEFALDLPSGAFPCVKLRGPAAIIALTSAVPRPPFVAAGLVGHAQTEALKRVLAHPGVARRTPVLLLHHPVVDTRPRLRQLRDGLVDAGHVRAALAPVPRGLVLFGHLHSRRRCVLPTTAGSLDVVCASGASLDHASPVVRAGYNLYEIAGDGSIATVEAYALDAAGSGFERTEIPDRPGCA